jgi:hypothetical protein
VDAIAERLHGYSRNVQDLTAIAQRAVIEMRNAWGGGDFEHIALSWEHEAQPRLAQSATTLSSMAFSLQANSSAQRRVSGGGSWGSAGYAGGGADARFPLRTGVPVEADAADSDPWPVGGSTSTGGERSALSGADREASLVSVGAESENYRYELSLGKVEATADSLAGVDAHGNLGAAANASAAAYLGYAAGGARAGNDLAHVSADSQAFVGAAAAAQASGMIGLGGAAGHLGGEAFVGAKAVAGVSGTLAGATAAAGAEISYGIGVHADVDAALSATKVGIAVDVGAAIGLGAGVKLEVSLNPAEVMEAMEAVAKH